MNQKKEKKNNKKVNVNNNKKKDESKTVIINDSANIKNKNKIYLDGIYTFFLIKDLCSFFTIIL